jgi:hypothetical protein
LQAEVRYDKIPIRVINIFQGGLDVKKKIFGFALTLLLMVGLLPKAMPLSATEIYEGAAGQNVTWRLNTITGLMEINGMGPMYNWSNREVYTPTPWEDDKLSITRVVIANGVTTIGENAFMGSSLTSIQIPDSVTRIEDFALAWSKLTNVKIPDSLISVGSHAFSGNELTSLELPDSLISIGSFAFERNKLTSLVIPNGVTNIGYGAFAYNSLTSLKFPDSLLAIGDNAFAWNALSDVKIPHGVVTIGETAFQSNALTSADIPGSVRFIGWGAFAHNELAQVTIRRFDVTLDPGLFWVDLWDVSEGVFHNNPSEMTISASMGSTAQVYAESHGYIFVPLDECSLSTASSWAVEHITSAIGKGFVPADIQGNYKNIITRQEFCRMAVKWLEYATSKNIDIILTERGLSRNTNAFADTSSPDILAAFALGITSGTAPGIFNPGGQITREQAATMVRNTVSAAGMDASDTSAAGFADIDKASSWAVDAVNFVRNAEIMFGTVGGNFDPKARYTREQSIVTFNNISLNARVIDQSLLVGSWNLVNASIPGFVESVYFRSDGTGTMVDIIKTEKVDVELGWFFAESELILTKFYPDGDIFTDSYTITELSETTYSYEIFSPRLGILTATYMRNMGN